MTTLAQAEDALPGVAGLVLFSFPLHPSGKPATERAAHLESIQLPMLFLSGTRDKLAELDLLKPVLARVSATALTQATNPARGTLHLLDTADHGFKILKRTRQSEEDVYSEASRVFSEWLNKYPNQ